MELTNNQKAILKKIRSKYPADQFGIWAVYGEDPNADFGGHHGSPLLVNVQGRYCEVVDYAVKLSGFWQWGAGGRIDPVNLTILSYRTEQEEIWAKLNN